MNSIFTMILSLIDKARAFQDQAIGEQTDAIRAKLRDASFQLLWDEMAERELRAARIWGGLEVEQVMHMQMEQPDGQPDPDAIPHDPITELEPLSDEEAEEIWILDED
jgi:hypothetical protein